jgi:hypothetical protein
MFFYVVLPLLGAVLLFVINPSKSSLRSRLLMMVTAAIWVAPFLSIAFLFIPDEEIDLPWDFLRLFLAGPLFVLWLTGLGAVGLVVQGLLKWAFRRVRARPR